MDRLRMLLFVALVALAGCAGGPIDGTVTPTGDPSPTPPPLAEAPFPDGADADGINATEVADGHRAALRSADNYALTSNLSATVRDQPIKRATSARIDLQGNAAVGQIIRQRGAQGQRLDFYATNGTGLTRTSSGQSSQYNRLPGNTSTASLADRLTGDRIRVILQRFEFAASRTEWRSDEVVIVYESTALNNSSAAMEGVLNAPLRSNSSATLVLDGSGAIRELSVTARSETGDRINLSITHSDLGSTTVERPDWADRAESETTPVPTAPEVSFETSQTNATIETTNGTLTAPVVTFQHTGGDPVNRSELVVVVFTDGGQAAGYDLQSLTVPNSQLESADPLNGSELLEAGDSIRVVHVVPREHHGSIRIDSEAGTLTAGSGAVADGRLSSGDVIQLVWTGKQRPAVIATAEVT